MGALCWVDFDFEFADEFGVDFFGGAAGLDIPVGFGLLGPRPPLIFLDEDFSRLFLPIAYFDRFCNCDAGKETIVSRIIISWTIGSSGRRIIAAAWSILPGNLFPVLIKSRYLGRY